MRREAGARGSAPHGQGPRACSSREWPGARPTAATACHGAALVLRGRSSRFQHRVMAHAIVRRHSPDACVFSLAARRQRARVWLEADLLRRLRRERRQRAAPPRHGRPVLHIPPASPLSVPECQLLSLVSEQVFALLRVEVAVYITLIDQVRHEPGGARSHAPHTRICLCASPLASRLSPSALPILLNPLSFCPLSLSRSHGT